MQHIITIFFGENFLPLKSNLRGNRGCNPISRSGIACVSAKLKSNLRGNRGCNHILRFIQTRKKEFDRRFAEIEDATRQTLLLFFLILVVSEGLALKGECNVNTKVIF